MSMTEELREMLDERGIKHEDEDYRLCGSTKWKCDFGKVEFYEDHTNRFTMLSVDYDDDMTSLTIRSDLKPPERYVTPEQAIAATMGRKTCHMELLPDESTTSIQPMRCTACGHKTYAQLANYCPNCGAEVVE